MRRLLSSRPEHCTGCRICEVMCALAHGRGLDPGRAHLRVVRADESGLDIPVICRQCEDAPCARACPANAFERDPASGALIVLEDACVGCLACIEACPHGVVSWDEERKAIVKCDLCQGQPTCVASCPKGALAYGPSQRPDAQEKDGDGSLPCGEARKAV